MSGDYRFYRQLTKGAKRPYYEVTPEYREYVLSLPPDQQVQAIERVIKDMSEKQKSYYRRHFPTVLMTDEDFYYPLSHFYSHKQYSFATHRPKYYR